MKIRAITTADIPVLAKLMRDFEAHLGHLEGKPRRLSVARARRDFERAGIGTSTHLFGLLAEDKSGAVGFALYYFGFNGDMRRNIVFVSDFFVHQTARRKGVGRALMAALRKLALKRDCARIDLAVWTLNPGALAFYLDLGFKPIDDEIVLGWRISRRPR